MKLKNRKLINTLVACFVVVLMAGTAFAFVSQGPLVFQGTANVDASLTVEIVDYRVIDTTSDDANYNVTIALDGKSATFNVDLTQPEEVFAIGFDIQNMGTLPAEIWDATFEVESDGTVFEIPITGLMAGQAFSRTYMYFAEDLGFFINLEVLVEDPILLPGAPYSPDAVIFNIAFGAPDDVWKVQAEVEMTITVSYRLYQ